MLKLGLKLARKLSLRIKGYPFKEKEIIMLDRFGPSVDGMMTLPQDFKVSMIDSNEGIEYMVDSLLGAKYIGMDAEWKATNDKHAIIEPATFQLSSKEEGFIIDMLALS